MGQQEVYSWLLKMRLTGNHNYFSTKEVQQGLYASGKDTGTTLFSVSRALRTLARDGRVHMQRQSEFDWLVVFRLSDRDYELSSKNMAVSQQKTVIVTNYNIPTTNGKNC